MAYYQQPHDVTTLPAWQALQQHRAEMAGFSMREAFAADTRRYQRFSLDSCGLLLDYSKNLIDERGLELLIQLAEQAGLQESIANLFNGEQVNASEGRAALHTALRSPIGRRLLVDGHDIIPEVHRVLNQVTELVSRIHSGLWRGYSEKPIKEVVNIGIGGSFLGPQLVSEALRPFTQRGVRCHYLANIDGSEFRELTARLNPETTLFIVSSKSFGTLETLKNTLAARDWYLAMGGPEEQLHRHFIAVTSNRKAAIEFGIGEENIFPMWDWVGGRYSLWSAIGLPIALAIGVSNFKELLAGAYAMDEHFTQAPLAENMPVLMALLGIWYTNFWGAQSHAILPYDHYLRNFTKHLQQLDMESNGKSVRQDGTPLDIATGPIIWGGVGCNGQHAYHQLLHQGRLLVPADFIVPVNSYNPLSDHHQWLFANCLSQAQALMQGKTREEAEAELRAKGLSEDEVQRLAPHKVIINAFDQWGVELGKEMGKEVYQRLTGANGDPASDASTQGLIEHFRSQHRG